MIKSAKNVSNCYPLAYNDAFFDKLHLSQTWLDSNYISKYLYLLWISHIVESNPFKMRIYKNSIIPKHCRVKITIPSTDIFYEFDISICWTTRIQPKYENLKASS
jgi:hypothetical protein